VAVPATSLARWPVLLEDAYRHAERHARTRPDGPRS
jgi:hypothetical protein